MRVFDSDIKSVIVPLSSTLFLVHCTLLFHTFGLSPCAKVPCILCPHVAPFSFVLLCPRSSPSLLGCLSVSLREGSHTALSSPLSFQRFQRSPSQLSCFCDGFLDSCTCLSAFCFLLPRLGGEELAHVRRKEGRKDKLCT